MSYIGIDAFRRLKRSQQKSFRDSELGVFGIFRGPHPPSSGSTLLPHPSFYDKLVMLYTIGLGLSDEKDITVRGLEIVKACLRVYLEAYTSILLVDKSKLVRQATIELPTLGHIISAYVACLLLPLRNLPSELLRGHFT